MMRKVIIIELEEDWTKKWWDILLLRKLFGIKMDQVEDFENSWSICKDLLHISLRVNNQFYEKFLNEISKKKTAFDYIETSILPRLREARLNSWNAAMDWRMQQMRILSRDQREKVKQTIIAVPSLALRKISTEENFNPWSRESWPDCDDKDGWQRLVYEDQKAPASGSMIFPRSLYFCSLFCPETARELSWTAPKEFCPPLPKWIVIPGTMDGAPGFDPLRDAIGLVNMVDAMWAPFGADYHKAEIGFDPA